MDVPLSMKYSQRTGRDIATLIYLFVATELTLPFKYSVHWTFVQAVSRRDACHREKVGRLFTALLRRTVKEFGVRRIPLHISSRERVSTELTDLLSICNSCSSAKLAFTETSNGARRVHTYMFIGITRYRHR